MLSNITTDEISFIGECNKLGLSSEQIFNLWSSKLKQEELKLQIELSKFNSSTNDEESNNIKKRKREETSLQLASDSKLSKTVDNRHIEFCDDILGKILEYLHFDLEVLRYIGVSKQFQRNILEKTKHITVDTERKVFPPYLLPNVESLTFICNVTNSAQLEFIYKCVNIKNLWIEVLDCGESMVRFKFPKPSIETIYINLSNNKVVLEDRNLFNLKKFEFWEPRYNLQTQEIINNHTYSLKILSLKEFKFDLTPILKLPLLHSLELDKLDENQLLIILNNLKKLEVLKAQIVEMLPATSLIEPDTKSVLNLKYLNISARTPSVINDKIWKYDFSNLKVLQMENVNLSDNWKSFSSNNTFTNLEVFDYQAGINEQITTNIGKCENLKNVKHLGILFVDVPRFDYGVFQKHKFKHLETLYIKGYICSFICNLIQIEGLRNLQGLHLFIDSESDLIDLSKSTAFSNLKHLGISYRNEYPEEFFKNLSVNFVELLKLDCSFKNYQDIELLRKYHPTNLECITIDDNMPSLGIKVLSKWKEIMWMDRSWYFNNATIMEIVMNNINTSLENEILRRE